MERDCYNCDWFISFEGAVNVCCKHKIEIVPHDSCWCLYWTPNIERCKVEMNDDLHDNDAMDRQIEADDHIVPTTE